VQNSAARLLTATSRYDHVTPLLRSLHWLPVSARIDFKILLLVFKVLNGLEPLYLSELLEPYIPNRNLRSAKKKLLVVPKNDIILKHMDIERSLIELPLCGTPYPMTSGKWTSRKHLSLNLKLIYLGSSFIDFFF